MRKGQLLSRPRRRERTPTWAPWSIFWGVVVVVVAVFAQRTGWWLNHSFEKYICQIEIISPFQGKNDNKILGKHHRHRIFFILSTLKTKAKYEESIITNFNHTFEKNISLK